MGPGFVRSGVLGSALTTEPHCHFRGKKKSYSIQLLTLVEFLYAAKLSAKGISAWTGESLSSPPPRRRFFFFRPSSTCSSVPSSPQAEPTCQPRRCPQHPSARRPRLPTRPGSARSPLPRPLRPNPAPSRRALRALPARPLPSPRRRAGRARRPAMVGSLTVRPVRHGQAGGLGERGWRGMGVAG